MAPIPEAYFPSLDKCFSGDAQILSWKNAFLYTNNAGHHTDDTDNVAAFLSHPDSIQRLSQSLSPFSRPSAKSKSEFESKTAAIHAETSSRSSFDLKEIKADAQWLSQTANVDEITALRITILEWQDRPAARLTTKFSNEEATSLQSAAGVDSLRVSVAGPNLANILRQTGGDENTSAFDSEKSRRLRLRNLYISERGHILKTFRKLLVLSLHDPASDSTVSDESGIARKVALCKLGAGLFKDKSSGDGLKQFLEDCIAGISKRLKDVAASAGWLGASESNQETEAFWKTTLVEEIVHILQLMFHRLQASAEVPSGILLESWLGLMAEYDFLEFLQVPCEQPKEVLLPLQSFVSLTTLAFLKVPVVVPCILERRKPKVFSSGQEAYFLSKDRIAKITELLLGACTTRMVTATPAAYSWGLILLLLQDLASEDKNTRELEQLNTAVESFQTDTHHAGPSRGSEPSLYEDLIDCARPPHINEEQDPLLILTSDQVRDLAFSTTITLSAKAGSMSAIDDGLTYCWTRLALLDLIRATILFLPYSPEIVETLLAILNGTPSPLAWDSTGLLSSGNDPKTTFAKDEVFMDRIFRVSRSRFPYETVPFLKLCRALVSPDLVNEDGLPQIVEELESINTYTQSVASDFQGYETIREDENANFVSLTQALPMFESLPHNRILGNEPDNALVVHGSSEIPATSIGQVISESKPAVIMWQHEYSCLSYLGSWLEEWSENGGYSSGWDPECGTEIIGLLADLVASSQNVRAHDSPGMSAKRILEMASDGLSRQGDIISVVLDIFERSLQDVGSRGGAIEALDLLMACMQFIQEVLRVLPNRVWPFLSRSSFIGSDGKGGVLAAIISAVEIPAGEYPFLLSCIRLFEAAVDDAVSRAVLRKCPGSVSGKSTIASDWSAGIPSHVMRTILLNFTRTVVEIFNSNGNWRFNLPEQQFRISASLASAFDRILYYAYGISDSTKIDSKVTGVFSDSAAYILDMLRPRSTTDLPFNAILRLITDGLQTPPTLHLRYLDLVVDQVSSTLRLSDKLVQAARLAGKSDSLLEEQLFKATPVLAKLYAIHDAYRLPVVSLLDTLVTSASSDADKEPPSLVGHLGADSACLFLDVLAQLDKSLNDKPLLLALWNLLSTFVSKRQQWLAVFILTGASPRQTLKKSDTASGPKMRGVPFLQIALDKLAKIEMEDPQVALSLLQFVSRAQENWPWATPHLQKHTQFFNGILQYVSKLKISTLDVSEQIFATRIAAVVTDICAVYLFPFKELIRGAPSDKATIERGRKFFTDLIPLVQWLSKDAVEVSAYNASLHANLKKNFEMRYSGCKIADFKRSALEPHTLGREYYYNLGMGQQLLSYDFAWAGSRKQGFSEEFERANINLSLVEAQVSLLNSWKFFAVEHCQDFMRAGQMVPVLMAEVAQKCLEANSRPVPPEAIFARIQQVRVDFAQALTQCLVEEGARGAEVFHLLEVVWKALRSRYATYEAALVGDDTEYYRSLLNVLFLALQFHVDVPQLQNQPEVLTKAAKVSSYIPVIVEVVKTVVAQGFRSLTSYLHDEPDKCTPKDFAIIIAILQTCLQVKDADRLFEYITFHIQDNDTVRHATTLFSWADQLAIAGDPVYGEVSLSFLVKLSTLPMLAEHLAVEGVLGKLSTCRLTNILQQPKGFGPFDTISRVYTIWTGGFLPLCLNLLFNVVRAAPEVSAFLNQFEGQLNRAAEAFSHGHSAPQSQWISLSMASEAYSLALISVALDRFREAGPSAGLDPQSIQELKWDRSHVKDDIEELLSRRPYLRARIVPTNDKEAEWSRQPPLDKKHEAESRLEEKIVIELEEVLACLNGGEE